MYLIPMMYLLVSTLSPGPVTVLTVHNTIRHGRLAGMSVGWGGAVTTAVFAAVAVALTFNTGTLNVSTPNIANVWQQGGAIIIMVMGLLTGYRSLFSQPETPNKTLPSNQIVKSFFTGIVLMISCFPQTILFYTVILPHYTMPASLSHAVLQMGLFKVAMTIGWYAALALAAKSIQNWLLATQIQKFMEFGFAFLLVGIGMALFIRS